MIERFKKQGMKLGVMVLGVLVLIPNIYFSSGQSAFPEYIYNQHQITLDEMREMRLNQVEFARNEIFARHGYTFKMAKFADYFGQQTWYTPNPNFSDALLNTTEKSNVAALKKYETLLEKYGNPTQYKTNRVDLNGDGKIETIVMSLSRDADQFFLKINGQTVSGEGIGFDSGFRIIDILGTDKMKEITITQSGPSDDYTTFFYTYDGKKVIFMGEIEGADYSFEGNGLFIGRARTDYLATWFHRADYKLGTGHKIVAIPRKMVTMHHIVTANKSVRIQKTQKDTATAFTIKAGEEVKFVSTDLKSGCLVMNTQGKVGWLKTDGNKIGGTPAQEVFEGFYFAD